MPDIHVSTITLHYELLGHWPPQRTPLLVIPGLGNDGERWESVTGALQERLPLIVLDNRGAGRSDAPEQDYDIPQMTADTVGLLQELDCGAVHVLGHSMGGFIAQQLAASHPELVTGLVLASTATTMSPRNRLLLAHWRDGILQGVDPEWITRDIFFWMYPPACYETPGFIDRMVREAMDAPYVQPAAGLVGQVAACNSFDGREAMAAIQAPTLVLHGELDALIPAEDAQALSHGIQGAELQVLPGAGHLPNQQMPSVFADAVAAFLQRL